MNYHDYYLNVICIATLLMKTELTPFSPSPKKNKQTKIGICQRKWEIVVPTDSYKAQRVLCRLQI